MRYTFEQIHEMVFVGYLKAREHERSSLAAIEFELELERNINVLSWELYRRTWTPLPLDFFVLTYPSVREVFAPQFRDRVVSHVLFNILSPIYERIFIYDSCSCRTGKGTLFGIQRFEHEIRSVTKNYTLDAYSLNLDISGYFMSINRQILRGLIFKRLEKNRKLRPHEIDYNFAMFLVDTFLSRDPLEGCEYHGNPNLRKLVLPNKSLFGQPAGVGLPIGDVINQLNSNIYLDPFDQFVKRELKIKGYIRYVDDSRQLHNSYDYLLECKERGEQFLLNELGLKINHAKTTITSVYEPNEFLGAVVLPFQRWTKQETVVKFNAAFKSLNTKIRNGVPIDIEQELSCINARLGYMQHFDARHVVRRAIEKSEYIRAIYQFAPNQKQATILNPNTL